MPVIATIPIDGPLAFAKAEGSGRRLVELLRNVSDPSRPAIGEWTIGDTAAHLVQIFEMYPRMARGDPSPVPRTNALSETYATYLAANPERDPRVLAGSVEKALADFVGVASELDPEALVPWHGGVQIPLVALAGLAIGEATVHGWDIARAEGRPWPMDPVEASLVIKAIGVVAPHFLTEEGERATASIRINLRKSGSLTFRFGGGELKVSSTDEGAVDCRISADPVAFLLTGYGRVGLFGPIATGKLIAYGRKPWLGMRFTNYMRSP